MTDGPGYPLYWFSGEIKGAHISDPHGLHFKVQQMANYLRRNTFLET